MTERDRDILVLFSDLVERRCHECAHEQSVPMRPCQERCLLFGCRALPKVMSQPRIDTLMPAILPNGSDKRRSYPRI
jgi:hypothetical protein